MNVVEQALRAITRDLDNRNRAWALVGGLAVSARAEPRFTLDVDLAVGVPDDSAAEDLVRSLITDGYRLVASLEHAATDRLATVRLTSSRSSDDVMVDLLFASSGIEPEIAALAERLEIAPGLTVPVAQVGHLIAIKLLARDDQTRPLDLADLLALLDAATSNDLAEARKAVGLIADRGFHRGRDLAAALVELLG